MLDVNVKVKYCDEEIPLNVSLDSGITLVLGETGAYKTTLLMVIGGVKIIEDGEVILGGEHIEEIPPSKRDMALIGAQTLPTARTVIKALMQPLRLRGESKKAAYASALIAADKFGLDPKGKLKDMSDLLPLFAARLEIRKTSVTMFDEPYHFFGEREEVTSLIRERGGEYTIVTSSSGADIRLLRPDNIIVMRRGKVLQSGKTEEVVNAPVDKYTELLIKI